MDISARFAPFQKLANDLLPLVSDGVDDAAHDAAHLVRVWDNVRAISAKEGGTLKVLAAATLLHDCVNVPKDSPERPVASRLAADKAAGILHRCGWCDITIAAVTHAIEAHSFSAQIRPVSTEARILQDADRLDAIGYTGVARCFYVSGRLGRALYDPEDPDASNRDLNDLKFAIDHFRSKLLKLSGSFQTETGQALAKARHGVVEDFLNGFLAEVSPMRPDS
ncbi:HD domain-containing protein [Roseobacter sp. S98]|uniref:HD domain-containing protein n=1 Tax=Roseobacter algicola (ex Choi et al. 2025) (nom. illeg.) TaxID=3092138 RepID=UPI0035C6676A